MLNHDLKVQVFNRAFEAAKEVQFNPAWANATGYFDNLCNPLKIKDYPEGEMFKTTDTYGRKLVIIGTYFGPLVVFERFKGMKPGEEVYVYNAHRLFDGTDILSSKSAIDLQTMQELFGHHDHLDPLNIGQKLKNISDNMEHVAIMRSRAGLAASKERKARTEAEIRANAMAKVLDKAD